VKTLGVVALSALVLLSSTIGFAEGTAEPSNSPDANQVEKSVLEEASMHKYGDVDSTCVRWTDTCRSCSRERGPLICSNIGIHCQPGKIECLARRQDKKQE
jgi:hypothetical protein